MVKLGELNSRMRDFYDIWLLARGFDFGGSVLAEAVRRTFENRRTQLPHEIAAFSDEFGHAKQAQWAAFLRRLSDPAVPADFATVGELVESFLLPVATAVRSGKIMAEQWKAPGPWQ